MRFLLRVDSHARNHSAHPQAQSQVAALRTLPSGALRAFFPAARSAPRVLCGSATASSAAPAGISSEFTASYLRLRSSLSCLIVRPCSHVRRSYLGYRHHFTSLTADMSRSGSVKAMSLGARWLRGCLCC